MGQAPRSFDEEALAAEWRATKRRVQIAVAPPAVGFTILLLYGRDRAGAGWAMALGIVGLVVCGVGVVLYWRCPRCGQMLGKYPRECGGCGLPLP